MRFNSIVRNYDEYLEYLKGKKVAMVCNGPCILERNDGELIDSMDVVIRFNQGYPEGREQHVGKRTDVVMMAIKGDVDLSKYPDMKVLIGATGVWGITEDDVDFISRPHWTNEFLKELGKYHGHPSSGCVMAWIAIDAGVSELHVFGHDLVDKKTWHSGVQCKAHDYDKEDEIYRNHAKDKGVPLFFH